MLRPWIQTLSSPFATRSTCFLPSLCQPRITPPWPLRMLNSYSERFTIARPNPMAQSSGCCVHTPSGTKDVSTPSSCRQEAHWDLLHVLSECVEGRGLHHSLRVAPGIQKSPREEGRASDPCKVPRMSEGVLEWLLNWFDDRFGRRVLTQQLNITTYPFK